jgi:hypothetical protein
MVISHGYKPWLYKPWLSAVRGYKWHCITILSLKTGILHRSGLSQCKNYCQTSPTYGKIKEFCNCSRSFFQNLYGRHVVYGTGSRPFFCFIWSTSCLFFILFFLYS